MILRRPGPVGGISLTRPSATVFPRRPTREKRFSARSDVDVTRRFLWPCTPGGADDVTRPRFLVFVRAAAQIVTVKVEEVEAKQASRSGRQ